MQISIAMCTWNGSSFLSAQLDSIARQTRRPDELVICDDVSSDSTVAILRSFSAMANFPVRIVENQTRLGSTANFSKAISLCQGSVIVLSDQDDVWQDEKLVIIEQHFESNSALGGIFTDAELIDQHGNTLRDHLWSTVGFGSRKKKVLRRGGGLNILMQGNFVTGATFAFRSCWKELVVPTPAGWVHDYWIALLISAVSHLDFEPKSLIQYRCHPAQQLGVRKSYRRNVVEILHRLAEIDNTIYLQAAQRCDEISCRLSEFDAAKFAESIARCHAIAAHLRSRGTLPLLRLKRIPVIFQETINGNYFRHSFGIKSILRDCLSDFRHGTYR